MMHTPKFIVDRGVARPVPADNPTGINADAAASMVGQTARALRSIHRFVYPDGRHEDSESMAAWVAFMTQAIFDAADRSKAAPTRASQ